MPTLSEIHNSIHALHKLKKEIRTELRDVQKGIDESLGKKTDSSKLLAKQKVALEKMQKAYAEQTKLDKDLHERFTILDSQKSKAATEEISKYKSLLTERQTKDDALYRENRDKLFQIIHNTLVDKEELKQILNPKGAEGEVSTWEAVKFAASHPLTMIRAAFMKGTLEDEVDKFLQIITGADTEKANTPSFVLRLLNDQEFVIFLQNNTKILSETLHEVVPLLSQPILSALSNLEPFDTAIKEMKDIGIDAKYINTALLPLVRGPLEDILTHYQDFIGVISLRLNAVQTTDPQQRQKLLSDTLKALPINRLARTSRLGEFIQHEHQMVASSLIATAKINGDIAAIIKKYSITPQLITDIVEVITELSVPVLRDDALLNRAVQALGSLALAPDTKGATAEEQVALEQAAIKNRTEALTALADIVTGPQVLSTLTKSLPQMLTQHKDALAFTLSKAITEQTAEAEKYKLDTPLLLFKGIPQETLQKIIPTLIDSANSLLSSASQQQVSQLFATAKTFISTPDTDIATRDEALRKLTAELIPLFDSKAIQSVLAQNIPTLLQDPDVTSAIPTLLANIKTFSPERNIDIPDEEVKTTMPFIAQVIALLPAQKDTISAFYKHIVEYNEKLQQEDKSGILHALDTAKQALKSANLDNITSLPKELGKISINDEKTKPDALPMLHDIKELLKFNKDLLSTTIPEYLKHHPETIKQITKFALQSEDAQKQIADLKITTSLVEKSVDAVSKFAVSALPVAIKILEKSINEDPENLAHLIELFTLPDSKNKSPKIHAMECVSAVYSFAKKNPEIADSIKRDIPKLFEDHADELGGVLDEFLNKTSIGKKYNIQGQELLTTASKHLPQLLEITDLYAKHEYAKMIPKAISLLFNKDVFTFCVKLLFTSKTSTHEPEIEVAPKTPTSSQKEDITLSLDKIKQDLGTHVVSNKEQQPGTYNRSKLQEKAPIQKSK